jgi:hypothetical protein
MKRIGLILALLLIASPCFAGPEIFLGSATAGGGTVVTWNASDKGADITLTNGNLTATDNSGSNWELVRATTSKSTGKWYWEIYIDGPGPDLPIMVGIATSATSTSSYPGSDAFSFGYLGVNGSTYPGSNVYGSSFGEGYLIGVAWNATDGTLTFYLNGSSQGVAFTGISGSMFPAVGIQETRAVTANFGHTAFAYTPPSGYTAIGQ